VATSFGIDRFLNVRTASGPTFSPDGRFVAFLTNITGVSQLWQVPVAGGWPEQLTFARDSVRGAHYNPVRYELIYGMDKGGNERSQLYLLRGLERADHGLGDGWESVPLTAQPKAVHSFGGWSRDGKRFAFSGNRTKASRFDIYIQNIGDKTTRLLARGPGGYYGSAGWSPDDRSLLVMRLESNFNQDLYVVDVSTGKARLLTPHKGNAQYGAPHWSAEGKAVYCTSTAGGRDLHGLARIDAKTGKLTYVATPKFEVDAVVPSPRGRWLAWTVNAGGKSELHIRDLKGRVKVAAKLPALGVVGRLTFAPDDSRLAFVFSGPRHNADVWLLDLLDARGEPVEAKMRRLTRSSRAGLPFDKLVQPQLIEYKTFDGRMIPAWYYPPAVKPNAGRLPPVIVNPHGGPESQTRAIFNPILHYFNQKGYAILAPNVRGSSGYGTAYMNLDNTTKRMDSVKDLAYAAHWLRDKKKGDPKRLAVFGGSYGGFMVLAAVTNYPDLWAAGIDVVGICNFVTFLEKTGAYRRAHREAEYGNLREHRKFLEEISPIRKVDKIKCPMMVIHGANDPRVPVGEAEQIVAALKKRKVPVSYLRYEDEGHGLAKLKNRLDAYPKMAEFLDRYLK
jgi:dipeptidyl aminopeptidase/acylaminoacyl peptidase